MSIFRFKQFSCYHDHTVFKIGTDAILLGSWASHLSASSILDVGSGTGIIALMLAQRHLKATITTIEIQPQSFQILQENISNSPWKNRFQTVNNSFLTHQFDQQFDLIVSNPPYFEDSLENKTETKSIARHTKALSFEALISKSAQLLTESGKLSLVFPAEKLERISHFAQENKLFLNKVTFVRGLPDYPVKRVLVEFSKVKQRFIEESLTVEIKRGQFSPEYCLLTKEFHPFL